LREAKISSGFSKYSQSIVFSAQRAVFEISLRGGLGVCPHKISLENQAQSAFLNIAPTFCIERSEPRRIIFSFINFINFYLYTRKLFFFNVFISLYIPRK
jgi:hypothetical protein